MREIVETFVIVLIVVDILARWFSPRLEVKTFEGYECVRVGPGGWSCFPTVKTNLGVQDAIRVLVLR